MKTTPTSLPIRALLAALLLPLAANAEFTYTIANDEVTITSYDGPGGAVVIPSTLGGHPVRVIGDRAFLNKTAVTSVAIPNSVTTIANGEWVSGLGTVGAFKGCTGLTSVTIPNSVTIIGHYAFRDCTGLTSVTIPDSVTSIGNEAFAACTGLTSITIPNSVTSIGSYAFAHCRGLTSITIPNSVTSIGSYAFYYCTGLTSITIPNSVTSIGSYAFYYCTGLTSITIPNSVTSIGSLAFYSCTGLTSVMIENPNTVIGSSAFFGLPSHASVSLPPRYLSPRFDSNGRSTLGLTEQQQGVSVIRSLAHHYGAAPDEYGIATQSFTRSHVQSEKMLQPVAAAASSGTTMEVSPDSAIHHITITGTEAVDLNWNLSALPLTGQAVTWEAWITIENSQAKLRLPAPENTAERRVLYLAGGSEPETSADGETLYTVWRAFRLGNQIVLLCNQWMNLPPTP